MNKYVEDYLNGHEDDSEDAKEKKEKEKQRLINELGIGEREYTDDGVSEDYPFWDTFQERAYRMTVGELSDEEYKQLLARHPKPQEIPIGLLILSFLFPIVGLILYIVKIEREPEKAKDCGKWALAGFIVNVVILILVFTTRW